MKLNLDNDQYIMLGYLLELHLMKDGTYKGGIMSMTRVLALANGICCSVQVTENPEEYNLVGMLQTLSKIWGGKYHKEYQALDGYRRRDDNVGVKLLAPGPGISGAPFPDGVKAIYYSWYRNEESTVEKPTDKMFPKMTLVKG